MLEIAAETSLDPRPAIVICAWDPAETGWDPIEDLSGEPWSPAGARTVPVPADSPETLATVLSSHLRDQRCRALLLVGRTHRGEGYRLQMRAENRTPDGAERGEGMGPSVVRTTAPVAEIVRALKDAGLIVGATSELEEDSGDYLLYQVLSGLAEGVDTPAIGLLRAPEHEPDVAVQKAVKLAAEAMTRPLAPLHRSRLS